MRAMREAGDAEYGWRQAPRAWSENQMGTRYLHVCMKVSARVDEHLHGSCAQCICRSRIVDLVSVGHYEQCRTRNSETVKNTSPTGPTGSDRSDQAREGRGAREKKKEFLRVNGGLAGHDSERTSGQCEGHFVREGR